MKYVMAMTTNVRRLLAAVRELMDRPFGVEGIGLLWGETGEGKTQSITYAFNTLGGLYVEVGTMWTQRKFAEALVFECGQPIGRSGADMKDAVIKDLRERPRPVFLDEAERLFNIKDGLEIVREIYDKSSCPVFLVGTEVLFRKIGVIKAMERRTTRIVKFDGLSEADARTVADNVCEVNVEDDLLELVYNAASKNIGRMSTGLSNIERFARTNHLESVSAALWGDRMFFPGQYSFKKGRR